MAMAMVTGMVTGMAMMIVRSNSDHKPPPQLKASLSRLLCMGIVLGAALQTEPATAGDWKFDHSTTLGLSHVDRTGDDGYSGQVLQATPNLHLRGESRRTQGDIFYQPTISVGNGSTDPEFLTHQGVGTGRIEAVKNRFFIGANASARLTGSSTGGGQVDAINYNSSGGQQSYSLGLSPEYRQHLSRYANLVARSNFNWVTYSGNDDGGSDDSLGQTLSASIVSGRHFNRFNWSLNATQRRTLYDSDQKDPTRTNYSARLGHRFGPRWAVNGSIGYEDNDIQSDRDDTNGATWDVGATWTPNPRTSVSARYGDRYFGETYSGNISHRTRRTQLSAGFSRNVTNRREQQLADSFFFLEDSDGNPVLDQNGNPITTGAPNLRGTDEDFINTQFRGAMTITGRRTNVTIAGRISNRDYEVSGDDEDSYGLTVSARRDLGSSFNATLTGRTDHNDSNDTHEVRFSLSKNLSQRTSMAFNLGYRDYNADGSGDSYTEKRIGISFTTTYL